jgi:hypothetical protein
MGKVLWEPFRENGYPEIEQSQEFCSDLKKALVIRPTAIRVTSNKGEDVDVDLRGMRNQPGKLRRFFTAIGPILKGAAHLAGFFYNFHVNTVKAVTGLLNTIPFLNTLPMFNYAVAHIAVGGGYKWIWEYLKQVWRHPWHAVSAWFNHGVNMAPTPEFTNDQQAAEETIQSLSGLTGDQFSIVLNVMGRAYTLGNDDPNLERLRENRGLPPFPERGAEPEPEPGDAVFDPRSPIRTKELPPGVALKIMSACFTGQHISTIFQILNKTMIPLLMSQDPNLTPGQRLHWRKYEQHTRQAGLRQVARFGDPEVAAKVASDSVDLLLGDRDLWRVFKFYRYAPWQMYHTVVGLYNWFVDWKFKGKTKEQAWVDNFPDQYEHEKLDKMGVIWVTTPKFEHLFGSSLTPSDDPSYPSDFDFESRVYDLRINQPGSLHAEKSKRLEEENHRFWVEKLRQDPEWRRLPCSR